MKGYKNKLFASILAIAMLFVFSSCEEDDNWYRGDLTFSTSNDKYSPVTDRRGEFDITVDFYDTDITGYDSRWNNLREFKIYNSWLSVFNKTSFREGDEIDIYIEAKGVGTYETTLRMDRKGYGEVAGNYDSALLDFMYEVVGRLLYNGSARLRISGKVFDKNGRPVQQELPFDITLENSLDLRISN